MCLVIDYVSAGMVFEGVAIGMLSSKMNKPSYYIISALFFIGFLLVTI